MKQCQTWPHTRGIPNKEKPTKYGSPQKTRSPLTQIGTTWTHQKDIRERRLVLSQAKSISTPSKALLLLSIQMTHINAREVTFHVLYLFLLAPLFQLKNNIYFTDLGITHETPNHLKISYHNLMATLQYNRI